VEELKALVESTCPGMRIDIHEYSDKKWAVRSDDMESDDVVKLVSVLKKARYTVTTIIWTDDMGIQPVIVVEMR